MDLTEETNSFFALLESKRSRHDEDVKWAITAMKKIGVAKIMGIDTS